MNLEKEIFDIMLQDIIPNRFQPREIFNDNELQELAASIKEHGVIQPIIVRKVGDKYEIIAGERRFRASQLAGKDTIPALVRDIDDKEAAKIALLENLQRSNLTPIEEAKTYQTILKIDNITQDELAANLGRSQSTIANKLRLLTLNEEVQTALLNSQISERHARSLLGLNNEQQLELLHKTINEKLTVRQLDEEIMKITGKAPTETQEFIGQEGAMNMNQTFNQTMQDPQIQSILDNVNQSNTVPTPEPIVTVSVENNISEENNNPVQPNLNNVPGQIIPNINNSVIEQTPKVEENVIPIVDIPSVEPQLNIKQAPVITEPQSIENPVDNIEVNETPIVEPKTENIFDKLRVDREDTNTDNMFELKTPDMNTVITPQIEESNNTESYNDIYDLRFAINNFRQAVQNTEKFGFKVNTTENDIGDKYQIIIEIDKK